MASMKRDICSWENVGKNKAKAKTYTYTQTENLTFRAKEKRREIVEPGNQGPSLETSNSVLSPW